MACRQEKQGEYLAISKIHQPQTHHFSISKGSVTSEDGGPMEISSLAVKSGWGCSDAPGFHEGKLPVLGWRRKGDNYGSLYARHSANASSMFPHLILRNRLHFLVYFYVYRKIEHKAQSSHTPRHPPLPVSPVIDISH